MKINRRTKIQVTLAAFLAGWSIAGTAGAQTIQNPFAGNRPFAPSAPQGRHPDSQRDPLSEGRPFAPSVRPEVIRDRLLGDIARWMEADTAPSLGHDRVH